jgi:hypothetical protein
MQSGLSETSTDSYRHWMLFPSVRFFFFLQNVINMSCFFSAADHVTTVKHLLLLPAALINGTSSKFFSNTVPQWMWSVKSVNCTREISDRLWFESLFQVDSNGNTIFHLLVIHNLPEMYIKFKKHLEEVQTTVSDASSEEVEDDKHKAFLYAKKTKIPLWKHRNNDGLTPLTLAAKLGGMDMFSFLLNERKIVQWRYGPVSCVLYPLDEIDLPLQEVSVHIYTAYLLIFVLSILIQNQNTLAGALELIVQNARVELITHPRLIDLVKKKWERFARRSFYRRFFATLTYLLIFLITTILDQTQIEMVRVLY